MPFVKDRLFDHKPKGAFDVPEQSLSISQDEIFSTRVRKIDILPTSCRTLTVSVVRI